MSKKVINKIIITSFETDVIIPNNSKILYVDYNHGQIELIALVDLDEPVKVRRIFYCVRTNEPFDFQEHDQTWAEDVYIGSVKIHDYVQHVFELSRGKT